jgi:hypothetical protein
MNCPQCDTYNDPDTVKCDCGYIFTDSQEKSIESPRSFLKRSSESPSKNFTNILRILLLVSIISFGITHLLKNKLPAGDKINQQLLSEPVQNKESLLQPFQVSKKGFNYNIEPQFNYDIYGLVVSYHESNSFIDIHHDMWKDYLNVKDLCVIWGYNIRTKSYLNMKFSSADFRCFCSWPDQETGSKFSIYAMSNNHLIASDKKIISKIMSTKIGDQIHIRGYLSKYSHSNSKFFRGTSTTRKDTGDGACETIFVTEFDIIKSNNPIFHLINKLSIFLIILIIILMFINLHRSY